MASADSIQNTAMSFANSAMDNMNNFANSASNYAWSSLNLGSAWASPANVPSYNGTTPNPPSAIAIPSVTASLPPALNFSPVITGTFGNQPALIAAEPVLNIMARPSSALPSAPGAAPQFNMPALPNKPTATLPPAPTFVAVAIPPAPALDGFAFGEILPGDELTAPSERFSFVEREYQSVLLDSLKAKLMKDLVEGGYGIENDDESGLWEREREREMRTMSAAIDEVTRLAAARGMMQPPGALNAAIARAQQESLAKISSVNREIAIKRADLYVENRKFTIQEVRQVEDMLIRLYGSLMERALNAAKSLVELGIAAYNAKLAMHNYRLERYKASASVYEAMIRGQLLKIEQYKAQVDAAKLSADTQRVHADVYRIQIEGVNALINLYRTEMDASKVAAEIEQLKLQGYKTSVDAFSAQVGAKSAEFGMYEASIKGEMAKVSVYESQVRAFSAQTDGYKTQIESQDVLIRAQMAIRQSEIEGYKAGIQRYSAELGASQQSLAAAIAKHEADVKQYSVTVDAAMRVSQQNIEAGKANADIAIAHAQVIASTSMQAGQILSSKAMAASNTMAHVASAYGSAAGAAMSAAVGIEATIN